MGVECGWAQSRDRDGNRMVMAWEELKWRWGVQRGTCGGG